MRMAPIGVTVVLCLGCAGPRESETEKHAVAPAGPPQTAVEPRETIRKLVEESDVIVLGTVTGIRDGTARDAGMIYDVVLDTVLYGSDVPTDVLRFRSEGWVGYAKYDMDETVLLFLKRSNGEFVQVHPVSYLAKKPTAPGFVLQPLEDCLVLLKSEIERRRNR